MCAIPLIVTPRSLDGAADGEQSGPGWQECSTRGKMRDRRLTWGDFGMPKLMHETQRLAFDGAVDADGHILEPPDLWETHLEPKYRDRALRIVRDENGLEELEIGGRRSELSRRGFPSTLGAMGDPDLRSMQFDPE